MNLLSKMKASAKFFILAGICAFMALAGTTLYAYMSVARDSPEIKKVSDYHPPGVTQILSTENGKTRVMAEFYKEKRYLTPYDQIPQKLVQAFLSAEDSTFFEHQGVNFYAIIRAAIANFLAGQVVQGGSTITQQIAKSLYLSPDRNLVRKIKELFLAFQLEKYLSKEDILYLYLNQIYLGSGAYGVQSAAQTYFHKNLKDLTIAEMALIAGLPTAPGKYSPLINPKKAKERQLYVLRRMRENQYITDAEQKQAAAEKVKIYVSDATAERLAPHFIEHLRRYLVQKYGEKALYEDGMTITVPGGLKYFEYANEALRDGLETFDQTKGYRGPIKNLDPREWEIAKEEMRKNLTQEYFPYRYLTQDGSLNLEEAIEDYDPTFEKTLMGKKLKALVIQIAPDKKSATASIGLTTVQIPYDGLKWAAPVEDPKKTPKNVADVLHLGDEIWIKPTEYTKGVWKAKLTQIPEVEGALYSVDIKSGQILAMVGGYDFARSEFNRAVQARRQMGSTFKPFIYSAAIERGYTPASIIVDSPVVFDDGDNGVWKPENYEQKFYGDTTLRQALIESRNVPTVKIVENIRVQNVIDVAKRMGLDGPFNEDLSISLGSATASVQDLVHAFTAFPLQGKPFRAVLFDKIMDRDGTVLETSKDLPVDQAPQTSPSPEGGTPAMDAEAGPSPAPFAPAAGLRIDPKVAYVMTHLMEEVVEYGTGARANAIGRPLAGKTGTTQDFHDAWFVGFSPQVVTGVWVGYDDQRSLGRGETGARVALPIWTNFMEKVLKDYPMDDFQAPEGISMVNIDSKTGKRSDGPRSISEAFITGTEPGAQPTDNANSDTLREGN